jgi:hypothetical protein
MKKIFVSISAILIFCIGQAQDLCGSLDHQKLSQPFMVNMAAVRNFVFGKGNKNEQSASWRVYPVLRLNTNWTADENYSFTLIPEKDALILTGTKTTAWLGLETDTPTVELGISMLLNRETDRSGDFRKNVFFLRPLGYIDYDFDLLVYCENGKLVVEDDQANKYNSLAEFIKAKYGSLEKYAELSEENNAQENIERTMPVNNMNEALSVITTYGYLHSKYFPTDTLGNLNCMLNDIQAATPITSDQEKLLRAKVLQNFEKIKSLGITGEQFASLDHPSETNGYSLMNMNIDPIITSVLTRSQIIKWERWLTVKHRQLILAENMIDDNLRHAAGKSMDDKRTLYEEKMKSLFVK